MMALGALGFGGGALVAAIAGSLRNLINSVDELFRLDVSNWPGVALGEGRAAR